MNIFFVIPYVPNHIRVRPYNFIKSLAKRGHKITLFTLWSTGEERQDLKALSQFCQRIISSRLTKIHSALNLVKSIPTNQPLQSAYCWHPALYAKILKEVRENKPDVIHVEHMRGSRYGIHLLKDLQNAGISIPIIWDSVDCITYLFQQAINQPQSFRQNAILWFELPRTKAYEREVIHSFPHILVTSQHDKESLTGLGQTGTGGAQIHVIPNGVDLDYFRPDEGVARSENHLIVSGKMSYHANIRMVNYLLEQIMPRIWAELPRVELWIVGKDPPAAWQAYAQHPKIVISGTVPDLRPYLQNATIAVAPITYGAGIQNKVLEAMACATPVVATSKAISALEVKPDEHLMVADTPDDFANKVLRLLSDHTDRSRIAQAGLEFVQARHNWGKIATSLEEIYFSSLNQPSLMVPKNLTG